MTSAAASPRNDIAYMRDAVLFEGPTGNQKLSRFWILLVLAALIATAGVVADSPATVIGAMIVAPMMIPIQGITVATVIADRAGLIRSILLVVFGAAAAVVLAYVFGLLVPGDVVAASNSQVAGRVSPGLIDLIAALGTGVVGSIALIRRDISDTLPGVAIAISLVPPLSVCGLTLESCAYGQALGALLLFITNVVAILTTGIVVMAIYGVHRLPAVSGEVAGKPVNRRNAVLVIVAMVVLVGVPLTASTIATSSSALRESTVHDVARDWAEETGWDILTVSTQYDGMVIRATGPLPLPDTDSLGAALEAAGVDPALVRIDLVPSSSVQLTGAD